MALEQRKVKEIVKDFTVDCRRTATDHRPLPAPGNQTILVARCPRLEQGAGKVRYYGQHLARNPGITLHSSTSQQPSWRHTLSQSISFVNHTETRWKNSIRPSYTNGLSNWPSPPIPSSSASPPAR